MTSEPNSLWENATSEPNSLWENLTSEPNSLWENVTSEPNSLWENATNEPTKLWENLTNEPTALCENLANEPKLVADGADGESVELSASANGRDVAYLETEMDEEKVGEWLRAGIERQRELRAKTLRALNATRPEVYKARATRPSRGGGNAEHRVARGAPRMARGPPPEPSASQAPGFAKTSPPNPNTAERSASMQQSRLFASQVRGRGRRDSTDDASVPVQPFLSPAQGH